VLRDRPDVVFVIAGQEGELTSEALAAERAHPGHVFVCRNVVRNELPLFYASATLVVVPSISERACLGLSIAEAMATGKATIVADVGGAREVAVDGMTSQLIPAGDPASLTDAIVGLLQRPDEIRRFGALGRKRVEAAFDVEQTNTHMEQVLKDVIG
jgi:glycosyltransferase involved in cell wall biosynthesis